MELFTIAFLLIVALLIYILVKRHFSYWKNLGLPYLGPKFFLSVKKGNSTFLAFPKLYNEMKRRGYYKHGGAYIFFGPVYVPLELDLIKNILTKDFDHFVNHGIYFNEEADPLTGHLFFLEDEKWRKLRAKFTPAFTSGKMRMMFQTLLECSAGLNEILNDHAIVQDAVDIKSVLARFTVDVIGSVAFGLDFDSIRNPNSKFIENGRKVFDQNFISKLKQLSTFVFSRKILHAINMKIIDQDVENFFMKVVKDIIKYRLDNNIYRKDFMHMMIQLKNRGKLADDGLLTNQDGEEMGPDSINFNELAAQCFVFFIAGYETSATTMTFALLELALNQDIQKKLRKEIDNIVKKNNGEITYDGITEMKYLDMVVNETLRKHTPNPAIPRRSTKPYQVPGTNVVIEKDTQVMIPIMAIHRDSDYYPNPDQFDPERFSDENVSKRHPFAFLPFGEGPRHCIGSRFARLQSKVGIITILRNFKVDVHQKTKVPIKYAMNNFMIVVEGGTWLKLSKLD